MNPFAAPRTNYNNFYDEARFNLTWKLNTFIFLANIPLVVTAIFFPLETFLAVLFGWLVPFAYLILLYLTRKYKVLATFYVIIGTMTTGGLMNFVATDYHVVEMTYMVMISLYAFITLGKTAGVLSIAGHCAWMIYYFAFGLNNDILRSDVMSLMELLWAGANFLLAFAMVGFLILEFIKLNNYAEEKYVRAQRELHKSPTSTRRQELEKAQMHQEIHHRIKNNLQVITNMLRLQSNEINDSNAQERFKEAICRVAAMSMIHEKLYHSKDFSALSPEEYISAVASDLVDSHSLKKPVQVTVSCSMNRLSNGVVVPFSMLIAELICNSLQAFEETAQPEITIRIAAGDGKLIVLHYSDNAYQGNEEMGLVKTLAGQLSGEISKQVTANGNHYRLEFPGTE